MKRQMRSWQECVRESFNSVEALADFLELPLPLREKLSRQPRFPLLVPRRLAEKMAKGTLDDPITRQFLPLIEEGQPLASGFSLDPVGDTRVQQGPHLLKKYEGRALLIATGACAMHCRYCFRQHYEYAAAPRSFEGDLAALREDTSISEVILSGGDPLSLSQRVLDDLIESIEAIPHVKRVRWHSRFAIGIPERIDSAFLAMLERSRLQMWFVIHCNHPRELDADVLKGLKSVQRLGIPVLNQAVLLRGVNDDIEVLTDLGEVLSNHGIFSYYLHQLDRVVGAAHFEVSPARGVALVEALRDRLSGYAVPKYVQEVAGAASKLMVLDESPR